MFVEGYYVDMGGEYGIMDLSVCLVVVCFYVNRDDLASLSWIFGTAQRSYVERFEPLNLEIRTITFLVLFWKST